MADDLSYFLNSVTLSASNTPASQNIATYGKRDMSIFLVIPTVTGGSGADTLSVTVEECDNSAFTPASQVKVVTLTSPTGTTGVAMSSVAGGSSTPTTYQQKWNLSDKNYSRYLRVRTTVAGTASVFIGLSVYLAYNQRV